MEKIKESLLDYFIVITDAFSEIKTIEERITVLGLIMGILVTPFLGIYFLLKSFLGLLKYLLYAEIYKR